MDTSSDEIPKTPSFTTGGDDPESLEALFQQRQLLLQQLGLCAGDVNVSLSDQEEDDEPQESVVIVCVTFL